MRAQPQIDTRPHHLRQSAPAPTSRADPVRTAKKTRLTVALIATLTAFMVGGATATPATASNSYNGSAYVNGAGDSWVDWWDEGVLSTTQNTRSNATCLWQKVLWAEGELAWDQIDGVFGPDTEAATVRLQKRWELPYDGKVGKETFGRAGVGGIAYTVNGQPTDYWSDKTSKHFILTLNSSGHYTFYDRSGNLRVAGYDYLTCT